MVALLCAFVALLWLAALAMLLTEPRAPPPDQEEDWRDLPQIWP